MLRKSKKNQKLSERVFTSSIDLIQSTRQWLKSRPYTLPLDILIRLTSSIVGQQNGDKTLIHIMLLKISAFIHPIAQSYPRMHRLSFKKEMYKKTRDSRTLDTYNFTLRIVFKGCPQFRPPSSSSSARA